MALDANSREAYIEKIGDLREEFEKVNSDVCQKRSELDTILSDKGRVLREIAEGDEKLKQIKEEITKLNKHTESLKNLHVDMVASHGSTENELSEKNSKLEKRCDELALEISTLEKKKADDILVLEELSKAATRLEEVRKESSEIEFASAKRVADAEERERQVIAHEQEVLNTKSRVDTRNTENERLRSTLEQHARHIQKHYDQNNITGPDGQKVNLLDELDIKIDN